jgi:hypothetical protein
MDLQLDSDHDLEIGDDGDLILVEDLDSIVQHLTIRLQFFLGEWFLDERIGFPYFEEVLRKAPDLNVVRSLFRDAILTTPGVLAVTELNLDYDGTTRTLSVSFRAATTEGPLTFDQEFIIPPEG